MTKDVQAVRVVVAHNDPARRREVAEALQRRRSVHVCDTAAGLPDVADVLRANWPDVLIVGDCPSGMAPAKLIARVRAHWPKLPILLLADLDEVPHRGVAALRAGATLQLSVHASPLKLVSTVLQLASPAYVESLARHFHDLGGLPLLTEREATTMVVLGGGLEGDKAADLLGVPVHIMERHVRHLIRKLRVSDRDELVWRAAQFRERFFLSA